MKKYKIYSIEYNNEIIYVGYTKNSLKERKRGRYKFIPNDILKKSNMILIEETDDVSRERYWVNYYKELGCDLYNKRGGDGLNHKEYIKNYNSNYYENNKEYKKLLSKNYKENNKEQYIQYMREYQKRDENKEKRKEYENKNRDKINENKRRWYKNKKEKEKLGS